MKKKIIKPEFNKSKIEVSSQFVFSENNKVLINIDRNSNEWNQINFQWIPVFELNKSMNK